VKVIDPKTLAVVATVKTGATKKADGISVDPFDSLVLGTCPAESHPFAVIIDAKTFAVVAKLPIPGALDLGQPVWSMTSAQFYIPVTTKTGGRLDVVDPLSHTLAGELSLGKMEPSGAVVGPGNQVLVGCATGGQPLIIDVIVMGKILACFDAPTVGRGIDQVTYDSEARRYFVADAGQIRVIDAVTLKPLASIPDGDEGAHAVAVDSATHQVFVPVTGKGVVVFAPK
jgi:DNA-binding beta-propeller fold protein YncE